MHVNEIKKGDKALCSYIKIRIREQTFQLDEAAVLDKAPQSLLANLSKDHPSFDYETDGFLFQRYVLHTSI